MKAPRRALTAMLVAAAMSCTATGSEGLSLGPTEHLPGVLTSVASGIADDGTAVGTVSVGGVADSQAVVWPAGALEPVNLPGVAPSGGTAISSDGRVIAVSESGGVQVSILVDRVAIRVITGMTVRGVNRHGIAVGSNLVSPVAALVNDGSSQYALALPSGYTRSSANAISDTGWVIGSVDGDGLPTLAARWRLGSSTVETTPGVGDGVNDSGVGVVNSFGARGARWNLDGSLELLDQVPGDVASNPHAINRLGDVVGSSNPSSGGRPVIWPAGSGTAIQLSPEQPNCSWTAYGVSQNWAAGFGNVSCPLDYPHQAALRWRIR